MARMNKGGSCSPAAKASCRTKAKKMTKRYDVRAWAETIKTTVAEAEAHGFLHTTGGGGPVDEARVLFGKVLPLLRKEGYGVTRQWDGGFIVSPEMAYKGSRGMRQYGWECIVDLARLNTEVYAAMDGSTKFTKTELRERINRLEAKFKVIGLPLYVDWDVDVTVKSEKKNARWPKNLREFLKFI